jgi:hypothetical protein
VASIGPRADAFGVEATFAAAALITLFFLLSWLFQTGRTLVEGAVSVALDTALATSGSEATSAPPTLSPGPDATRLATPRQGNIAAETTLAAPTRIHGQ